MPKRLSIPQTRAALRRLGIENTLLPAFGLVDEARDVRYGAHCHSKHQLLVPAAGVLMVETEQSIFVCNPLTGMWIPMGTRHATTLGAYPAISVFFSPQLFRSTSPARTFHINPLLREMIVAQSTAFGIPSTIRRDFFRVVFALVAQALLKPPALTIPRPKSDPLLRAAEYILSHLDQATVGTVAAAVGMSERTLRRHFLAELHISPEIYIQRARMLKAMQMLMTLPPRSIIEIALEVGYTNHSAFTAAFHRFFGKVPSSFRQHAPYAAG